ncbi:TolC family protein [Chitinophaga cymbidii]|nr:TolC family protein [Chitinophaga cymbidii]
MRCLPPLLLLMLSLQLSAQEPVLSLDSAQQQARQNYPLLRQQEVQDNITRLQLRNIKTNYLPQVELNGQATYQSAVTSIPIKLPNMDIPELSKDQYKATIDVKQLIYDGGATASQRDLQLAQQQAENQKTEVELYKLRQQVLQVYFNALLWNEHIAAREQMMAEMKQRKERLQAGVENGTVLASQVDQLQAELLKTEQQHFEAKTGRTAAYKVLSLLTGKDVPENTRLQLPAAAQEKSEALNRPELRLFRLQTDVLQQQSKLTGTRAMPKVSAFAQGGYGRPGLNMLENKFDFYYLAGLRLNWTLWNWRKDRTERAIIREQEENIQTQSDAFALNTRVQLQQQSSEIANLTGAIERDREIVELRTKVKNVSAAQLDNGVLTVHDYLTDLNAETQAVIAQRTHEIQLVYATLYYQVIKGY